MCNDRRWFLLPLLSNWSYSTFNNDITNEDLPPLPTTVKILKLVNINRKLTPLSIPNSVTSLTIEYFTKLNLSKHTIPPSVEKLSLRYKTFAMHSQDCIPPTVRILKIKGNFTQELSPSWIPPSVHTIKLPSKYFFKLDSAPPSVTTIKRYKKRKIKKDFSYKYAKYLK
ncbi:hypothetical protein DICPUDRAFT_73989 [Dictyostelium purpureum]|uniref:Uncharacterized protein n=1 Tax=Dictyostelium purpureum TaxID=5786 RepID=F0Z6G3_DICPU|nr:uncharacterized protein DICPUDRAFT_73989 [Dictyostelium purpureum]EGC40436.1 hypothetical protein DICPUDRAFT_73989 [Dictyostelium purpureum]|eukprot:XP_003282983.1 hypothetical protein DICPUDRAFT_73989 [Dictyostelium purpureum]